MMLRKNYILPLLFSVLLCSSCESKETKQAKSMLSQAQALQSQSRYEEAILLLDSLQESCPQAVAERREALALTRELRLHISTADSAEIAPRLAELIADLERRDTDFKRTTIPDMPDETLMRYRGYDPSRVVGVPFLDAYIQSDGQIEMVGGYTAPGTRDIVGMRIDAGDGTYEVSDTIAYDGGRNYRFTDGGQTHHRLTFSPEAARRMGDFVANTSTPLKVSFLSSKGTAVGSFHLSSEVRNSVVETYTYFATYLEIKNLEERLAKHDARREMCLQKKR